ncbi:MAG: helix-turn-helix transcriptional regulator [Oscillospiraceae bacterium]|nr:helix-turn-helix transcriptional regulator [Oscillospiraceae bacterium]
MISYEPLWKMMKDRSVTTYTLIYKNGISAYTITNLKHNKSITMNTLEKLCTILNCTPNEIVTFIKDETLRNSERFLFIDQPPQPPLQPSQGPYRQHRHRHPKSVLQRQPPHPLLTEYSPVKRFVSTRNFG